MTKPTTAPPATSAGGHTWWRGRGERVACAFTDGPGWMRSACGDVRWTVSLVQAHPEGRQCPRCSAAIAARRPAGPAMEELEARSAWGDR